MTPCQCLANANADTIAGIPIKNDTPNEPRAKNTLGDESNVVEHWKNAWLNVLLVAVLGFPKICANLIRMVGTLKPRKAKAACLTVTCATHIGTTQKGVQRIIV